MVPAVRAFLDFLAATLSEGSWKPPMEEDQGNWARKTGLSIWLKPDMIDLPIDHDDIHPHA